MTKFEIQLIRSVLHALSHEGKAHLPGLGSLIVESKTSESDSHINPPSRKMVFLASDGSRENLSGFFIDQLGEEKGQAVLDISTYFQDLKHTIKEGPVEWHGLGKFYTNENGAFAFQTADQWVNFLNPGFEPVQKQSETKEKLMAVPVVEESVESIAPLKEAVTTVPVAAASSQKDNSSNSSWIWAILSILILGAGLIYVATRINKKAQETQMSNLEDSKRSSSIVITSNDSLSNYIHKVNHKEPETVSNSDITPVVEVKEKETETPVETKEERSEEAETAPVAITPIPKPEVKKTPKPSVQTSRANSCVVVAGAFGDKNNARLFTEKLSRSFDNVYNQQHGKLYRVGVQCDCQEKSRIAQSLKSDHGMDSWSFKLK